MTIKILKYKGLRITINFFFSALDSQLLDTYFKIAKSNIFSEFDKQIICCCPLNFEEFANIYIDKQLKKTRVKIYDG